MRQAIETKWLSPTNYMGSRVKAKAWGGSTTVNWDYALGIDGNHIAAAKALVDKMGWDWGDHWVGGANASDTGFVFVDARDGR